MNTISLNIKKNILTIAEKVYVNRFALQYISSLIFAITCLFLNQLNFSFLFLLMASLMDGMNSIYRKNN